jgi:hypothetical protein
MRRACNAYGGEESCIQGFGEETSGKEKNWKHPGVDERF